jgi:alpha-tubulin suppressor-like RCC1 family protein
VAIAGGLGHGLALKGDGTVWSWGWNDNGQLGDGTRGNIRNTPVKVSNLEGVKAIAGGGRHSLALKNDGTVRAWGQNWERQQGNENYKNLYSNTPIKVSHLSRVKAIAGGSQHSLALKKDGTVFAWGYNEYGQLGNGTRSHSKTPVKISNLEGVTAIEGGALHSLAK